MKLYFTIFLIIILLQVSFAQECLFRKATPDDVYVPTSLWFVLGDTKYLVNSNGNVEVKYSDGTIKTIQIPLPESYIIDKILFSDCIDAIIMICQLNNGDGGCGRAFRINRNQLTTKWYADIAGFNVGEPFQQGNHLYLTSIDWVGKLDMITGKYNWEIYGLYKSPPGCYNSFERPYYKDGKIFFPESIDDKSNRKPLILIVDDKTGSVIEGAQYKSK